MKIKRNDLKAHTYEEVKVGEVFESFGEIYMKVNGNSGAVDLNTGFLYPFNDDEAVILVDASLQVGYI